MTPPLLHLSSSSSKMRPLLNRLRLHSSRLALMALPATAAAAQFTSSSPSQLDGAAAGGSKTEEEVREKKHATCNTDFTRTAFVCP
jgi:hypothetical protein